MSAQSQFEREEDDIVRRYNAGEISLEQFNKEMRDLRYDYKAAAEEAALDAYEREMERW